jgi:nucleoside-triphosphatase THEP1
MDNKKPSFIITGPSKSGKTTLCWDILQYLNNAGVTTGGVITLQNNERLFYLIQSKEKVSFEAREMEDFIPIGKFRVSQANLAKALLHIRDGQKSDYLFIDEIGLLEMENNGFYPELKSAVTRNEGNIFVVREGFIPKFQEKYDIQFDFGILRCKSHQNHELYSSAITKINTEYLQLEN